MLIARKPMRYRGRMLSVGDSFEAGRRDERILVAMRRAEPMTYETKAVKTYETKAFGKTWEPEIPVLKAEPVVQEKPRKKAKDWVSDDEPGPFE